MTQVYNRVYQPVTNTATPPVTRVNNVDTLVTTRESTKNLLNDVSTAIRRGSCATPARRRI